MTTSGVTRVVALPGGSQASSWRDNHGRAIGSSARVLIRAESHATASPSLVHGVGCIFPNGMITDHVVK